MSSSRITIENYGNDWICCGRIELHESDECDEHDEHDELLGGDLQRHWPKLGKLGSTETSIQAWTSLGLARVAWFAECSPPVLYHEMDEKQAAG